MSGAASSSTIPRSHVLPQNLVNQRPTMALFSSSLDMLHLLFCCVVSPDDRVDRRERFWNTGVRSATRFPLSPQGGEAGSREEGSAHAPSFPNRQTVMPSFRALSAKFS